MKEINNITKGQVDVTSLYPELTPEQQEEAAYYLTQYIDLVWRIYQRVRNERKL